VGVEGKREGQRTRFKKVLVQSSGEALRPLFRSSQRVGEKSNAVHENRFAQNNTKMGWDIKGSKGV